jgi:hypothetical protein
MEEKVISAVLRIEGGLADNGILDIYDASSTIYGMARATNIIAHSFANQEEVRTRASSAHGSQTFIHSSKKGCFEEQIDIRFDQSVVSKMGHSVLANNFWDYMVCSWAAAIGLPQDPMTPYVQKILKQDEDFFHVIADALETPMQKIHEPIKRESEVKIFLSRPRIGDVLTLNQDSLDYVTVREEQEKTSYIVGNVTRYNVLSDFGRLYSDAEGRVISFRLAHRDDARVRSLAIKSMQDIAQDEEGKINFKVSGVVSAQGVVKRYIVHDILPMRK